MRIDMSKVNLTEKDIEDWLFENPEDFPTHTEYYDETPIDRWIGRQYRLPSGIADLVGIRKSGLLVVAEVKNIAISKAAILQVCRYASDLEQIVANRTNYNFKDKYGAPHIQKIVIGPSIDDQTFMEAQACDVGVVRFSANLNLELSETTWTNAAYDNRHNAIDEISRQPEWNVFGIHYSDYIFAASVSDEETLDFLFGAQTNNGKEA